MERSQSNFFQILLTISILACNSSTEKSDFEFPWSITLVDSVQIPYLGTMMLLDISPSRNYFLTADYKQNKYFLIDPKGKIVQEINKTGDQPDTFGFAFSEMSFWGDTSVFVIGTKGIKWYNFEGKEIKSTEYNPNYQLKGILRNTGGGPILLEVKEGIEILYRGGPVLGKRTGQGYYDNIRGATLINPDNFNLNHYFPLEKDSRFFDGSHYDDGDLYSRQAVGSKYIYITFDANPVLYAYLKDNPRHLVFKKELLLKNVLLSEGMSPEFLDFEVLLDDSKGGLRNLQVDENYVYLMYFEGIPKERMRELDKLYEIDEFKADTKFIEEYNLREKRLKIFNLEGDELSDLRLPDYLNSYLGFIAKDGYLYFNKALHQGEEEDYFTIYKVKITP